MAREHILFRGKCLHRMCLPYNDWPKKRDNLICFLTYKWKKMATFSREKTTNAVGGRVEFSLWGGLWDDSDMLLGDNLRWCSYVLPTRVKANAHFLMIGPTHSPNVDANKKKNARIYLLTTYIKKVSPRLIEIPDWLTTSGVIIHIAVRCDMWININVYIQLPPKGLISILLMIVFFHAVMIMIMIVFPIRR